MTEDKEEIQVDIEDVIEELEVEGNRAKPEAKAKAEPVHKVETIEVPEGLRKQIQALEADRNAALQAKAQAEQEANKLAQAVQNARLSADQNYKLAIDSNLHHAKSRAEQIKREIKLAYDAGEHERVADLQMEAAHVAVRLSQYQDAKEDHDAKLKRAAEEAKEAKSFEIKKTNADPFEESISNLSEPSKNWLRSHKECVLNRDLYNKMVQGDHLARGNGIVPDTREYFEFIEEHMGYRQKPQPQTQEVQSSEDADGLTVEIADPKPVKKPLPAAPVSREAGHQGKPLNGKVRLTRAEAEIAGDLGMTPAEYAKWKIKAEQDGRYVN